MPPSEIAAAAYTLSVASLSFSPSATTYTTPQTVSISTTSPGATIRYTLDGTTPTASSAVYTSALTVANTTTLNAIGMRAGWISSAVKSGTYTMNFGTLDAPVFSPAPGTYANDLTLTLTAMAGATIRHTTAPQNVTTSSAAYSSPLMLGATTTLNTRAYHPDYTTSVQVSGAYTFAVATPALSHSSGTYPAGHVIAVSTATAGAVLRYTINGATPTSSDPIVPASGIVAGNFTLKVAGWKAGYSTSAVTTATYTVTGTLTPPLVAGGDSHSLAIRDDGAVWGWGGNGSRQLGDGTTTNRSLPKSLNVSGGVAASGGAGHSLVLRSDGSVVAWGSNGNGQLGNGSTTAGTVPALVTGLLPAVAISAGGSHSLAIGSTATVWAWGRHSEGQLGDASTTQRLVPVQVTDLTSVAGIAAGSNYSLALKADGSVWSWGQNSNGQLGSGNTTARSTPGQVSGLAATQIAAGNTHSLALLVDGTVRSWGSNLSGQLGDGTTSQRTSAVGVTGLTGIVAIAGGASHSLALDANGSVWAWGSNANGQLGDGTTTNRTTPVAVLELPAIVRIAAGGYHSLAIDADGGVWAWGKNSEGQVGDGTTANRPIPVQIASAGMAWNTPPPILTPGSGVYNTDQTVTITNPDSEAVMHYTTTGVTPTENDPVVASGTTVTVSQTTTLKVRAWSPGLLQSAVTTAIYTLKAATPSVSPAAGTYTTERSVTLATTTPGSSIHYTLDGTEPTPTSTSYLAPILIAHTTTLKAIAVRPNWTASDTRTAIYTMNFGTLAAPVIDLAGGTYEGQVTVAISSAPGTTIRYTTNGATPTVSSAAYTGPLTVTTSTVLKAKAFHPDYATSPESSATYTIVVPAPTLSLAAGTHAPGTTVTVTGDALSTLRFTVTGVDPTATDPVISSGAVMLVGTFALKVRAFRSGATDSAVVTAAYELSSTFGGGAMAAGDQHTLLATPSGLLYAWGANGSSRLGDGTTTARLVPTLIQTLTGVTAAAAGDTHSLAVTFDGRVFGWGGNTSGQVGDGTTATKSRPVLIAGIPPAVSVAAGGSHSLALTAAGDVYAWGSGSNGRLGLGTTTSWTVPQLIPGLSNVVGIAAGASHSLAVTSTGQVYAWGLNSVSQLGDGTTTSRLTPTVISSLSQVADIAAGSVHSLARTRGGSLFAWGNGANGQLGQGDVSNRSTPVQVLGLTAASIAAGGWHSMALRDDGGLLAWGDNATGQIGDTSTTMRTLPVTVAGPSTVALLAGGRLHSLLITPEGNLWTWGSGDSGRLGDGTTTNRPTPQHVFTAPDVWGATPPPALSLAPGTYHSEQSLTVTALPGAVVRYTTSGVAPTEADPILATGTAIPITATTTVGLRAWSQGRQPSVAVMATYVLQPLAPVATPPMGTYTSAQTVSLTTSSGATIRYTTDGSAPTETSTGYAAPFTIDSAVMIRARAFRTGWQPSLGLTTSYDIQPPTTAIALRAPAAGAKLQVSAPVTLSAVVTSNVPIVSISFYAGATLIGTANGEPSQLTWVPNELGVVALSATAIDDADRVTTSIPVSVTIAVLPVVTSVSPTTGPAGTVVTISGSGFGATQGSSSVWLGTKPGIVESWSDTAIAVKVAPGSLSGTVQVRVADAVDATSNELPFTVVTPVIATVTPASGPPGTTITIAGSGFGTAESTGGLWLGAAAVPTTSWSDTHVQATLPAGAASGSLQVLQGGVLSNGVEFIVTGATPRIDFVSPTSGAAGSTVHVVGSGFGDTRGSGTVLIGGVEATVISWSDASIEATVGPTAVTGIVKVQQNDQWSNGKTFRIQTGTGPQITLSPNLVNLVVGQLRSVQALDESGATVNDLTWSSSDPAIVTVSGTSTPVITAVAPGTVTITAGGGSIDVTVHAEGAMPEGTVLWSVPGPPSEVADIKVAVPAAGGVADAFAIGNDGTVQAIGADGMVAWTAPSPLDWVSDSRPDFQGGLVVFNSDRIMRLHPTTGQATTLYSNANAETQSWGLSTPAVHPDGTVMTVDYTCHDFCDGADADDSAAVVGIDVESGTRHFRVPLVNSSDTFTNPQDAAFCGNSAGNGTHTWQYHAWPNNQLTVAADGFAYLSYLTYHSTATQQRAAQQAYPDEAYDLFDQLRSHVNAYQQHWGAAISTLDQLVVAINDPSNGVAFLLRGALNAHDYENAFQYLSGWAPQFERACDTSETLVTKLHLMRVNGDGESSDRVVKEWTATDQVTHTLDPNSLTYTSVELHTGPSDVAISEHIITNATDGAMYSWQAMETCYASGTFGTRTYTQVDACSEPVNHLTVLSASGNVASDTTWNPAAEVFNAPKPVLQLADQSFVGSIETDTGSTMIAFDSTGHVKWTVPGVAPILATAEDTVIAAGVENITEFNLNGSAIGQHSDVGIQSWRGLTYRLGSVAQLTAPWEVTPNSLWAVADGNFARNGTAAFAVVPYEVQVDFQGGYCETTNQWRLGTCEGGELLSDEDVTLIKNAAIAAMKKAYEGYNVEFYWGTTSKPNAPRHIYVQRVPRPAAGPPDNFPVGFTPLFKFESDVYSPNLWRALTILLRCDSLQDCVDTKGLTREQMLKAFGKGIGNTAAHELGHQRPYTFTAHVQSCLECYDSDSSAWLAHFFNDHLQWSPFATNAMKPLLKRE